MTAQKIRRKKQENHSTFEIHRRHDATNFRHTEQNSVLRLLSTVCLLYH